MWLCFFRFTDNPALRLCVDFEHCLFRSKRILRLLIARISSLYVSDSHESQEEAAASCPVLMHFAAWRMLALCTSCRLCQIMGRRLALANHARRSRHTLCSSRCVIGTWYWFETSARKEAWAVGSPTPSMQLPFGGGSSAAVGLLPAASFPI